MMDIAASSPPAPVDSPADGRPAQPRIGVLIVDDDQYNRRGIADIFAATPDIVVVGEADDGDRVPAAVARHRPDVVLMDLRMRRVQGLDAIVELMKNPNHPRVVAMTALDVDDLVVRAFEAGAHSFLSKDEPPLSFHQAVRAVAVGNTLFSYPSLRRLVDVGGAPEIDAAAVRRIRTLTERERTVLVHVALGLSNREIAERMFVGETTVKSHMSSMNMKLGVTNRVLAAVTAVRAGIA